MKAAVRVQGWGMVLSGRQPHSDVRVCGLWDQDHTYSLAEASGPLLPELDMGQAPWGEWPHRGAEEYGLQAPLVPGLARGLWTVREHPSL